MLLLNGSDRFLISTFSKVTFFTVSQMSVVAACGKAPWTDVIVDRNVICTGSGSPPTRNGTLGPPATVTPGWLLASLPGANPDRY